MKKVMQQERTSQAGTTTQRQVTSQDAQLSAHDVQVAEQQRQASAAGQAKPAHEHIARRAYDIYVGTGCQPGRCGQNWRQAESELYQAKSELFGSARRQIDAARPEAINFDDVMPGSQAPGRFARDASQRNDNS